MGERGERGNLGENLTSISNELNLNKNINVGVGRHENSMTQHSHLCYAYVSYPYCCTF